MKHSLENFGLSNIKNELPLREKESFYMFAQKT